MTGKVTITADRIVPEPKDVLRHQGIPIGATIKDHIGQLVAEAVEVFLRISEPAGIIKEISKDEFVQVYEGQGHNDEESPIKPIFEKADDLALFAATMGSALSRRVQELFDVNDFARAAMLDSCASVAADNAAGFLEDHYMNHLKNERRTSRDKLVFGYSPGYCGWNIEAQKNLFEYLHPERIGITLNASYLMTPLKSVSGVLIHGDRLIHEFSNGFHFCFSCRTQPCLVRFEKIYDK